MPKFVVQEHNASHLHWDFRLEMDGTLKSWAIPKEPNSKDKRLAVKVADHNLSYINFHGEIKEGYGKGTVKIWDKGTYKLESKETSKIVFELKGKKLKGKFVLLKFTKTGPKNWLFFKVN